MKKIAALAGLIGAGALIAAPLKAADEPVDADLLEFLGTVDASAADWRDYLAATDVDALVQARTAKPTDPAKPPPTAPEKDNKP